MNHEQWAWGEEIKNNHVISDENKMHGMLMDTIYSSSDANIIKKMLSDTTPTNAIRAVRTIITDTYGPFGKIKNPYKSADITTTDFNIDNLLKIINECNGSINNTIKKTIVGCSICEEHLCTERYDMTGYNDAFVCGNWCSHEDNVFIPTKLFTDVSIIKNLCCKCVDNLVQNRKLVYYSGRTDIFIPTKNIYKYRTKFLIKYHKIMCEYLNTIKNINNVGDVDLNNENDTNIYLKNIDELQELSDKALHAIIQKTEQVLESLSQEFIVRIQLKVD